MHYNGKGNDKALWDLEMEILWGVFEKGAVHPFKTSINQNDEWVKFDQIMYDKDHTSKTSEEWKTAILNCGVENIFLIDEESNKQTYGISNEKGEFIVDFKFSVQPQNGDKNGRMHLSTINAEYYNNKNNFDMAKKYTKSEIEGMIKNLKEKEKKARSKWGKAVLQDAQWLLENVIEGYDEPYELSEKLVLNGAENWNQFSWGGSALVYNGEIAEHYSTPSEAKNFWGLTKDGGVKRDTNTAGEHLLDIQARALRQAWWAIRDEMNGTTEFSMSLCEFSEEGREKNNFEINDEQYDYKEAVKNDVLNYIYEHYEKGDITEENRDEIEQSLYDDLFVSDSVTGNASGSYTFNTWKAESYLCHNLDLLMEAMQEFGSEPSDFQGAEWGDVTIRCYLLSGAISEAIDEFLNENDDDSNFALSKTGFHFPNTNIDFFGTKFDTNGNKVFVLQVGGNRKFSVQTHLIEEGKSFSVDKGEDLEEWIVRNFGSVDNFKDKIIFYLKEKYKETKNQKYSPYNTNEDFEDDGFAEMMRSRILAKCRELRTKLLDGRKREINDFFVNYLGNGCYELSNKNQNHILQNVYLSPKKMELQLVNTKGKVLVYKFTPKGIPNWDGLYDAIEEWEIKNDKNSFDTNFSIIDDTKDVLKATGKLAGNIVKNTTDKGGLLMF